MLKKIMGFILTVTLVFSMIAMPVYAGETNLPTESTVVCTGLESINYTELDADESQQLKNIIKQYGVSECTILGIFEYKQHRTTFSEVTVPGWILLTGLWVSPREWKITVLNAGMANVNGYYIDVQLINKSYGPVSAGGPMYFPGLYPGQSDSRTCYASVLPADVAMYKVYGTVSEGEPFEISGADVRQ